MDSKTGENWTDWSISLFKRRMMMMMRIVNWGWISFLDFGCCNTFVEAWMWVYVQIRRKNFSHSWEGQILKHQFGFSLLALPIIIRPLASFKYKKELLIIKGNHVHLIFRRFFLVITVMLDHIFLLGLPMQFMEIFFGFTHSLSN